MGSIFRFFAFVLVFAGFLQTSDTLRATSYRAFWHVLDATEFGLTTQGAVEYSAVIFHDWLKLVQEPSKPGILFGTPGDSDVGDAEIKVNAYHQDTFKSVSWTLNITVYASEPPGYEATFDVRNFTLREFVTSSQNYPDILMKELQAIWTKRDFMTPNVTITKLKLYDRVPLPPEREGLFVSASPLPDQLADMSLCKMDPACPEIPCGYRQLNFDINWCKFSLLKSASSNVPPPTRHQSRYVPVAQLLEDDMNKSAVFYWIIVLVCCVCFVLLLFLGCAMCCCRHSGTSRVSDDTKAVRKATVILRKMGPHPVVTMDDWDDLILVNTNADGRMQRALSSDVEDKKAMQDSDSDDSVDKPDDIAESPSYKAIDSSGDDLTLKKKVPEYRYPPSYLTPANESPPSQYVESSRQPPSYITPPTGYSLTTQARGADSSARLESSRDPPHYKTPPHYKGSHSSLRSGGTDEDLGPAPKYQTPPQH
ncbi:alpha-sarcoglycan-like [Corticium candelabrum]|uniref:alpha-sarcoglycan-like n=1 Tax=Corticium candelabrum TaxID=121492 RepID=UPI002E2671C4|nr:alpha-sarcoglycan-like [Corticium candelabrum]